MGEARLASPTSTDHDRLLPLAEIVVHKQHPRNTTVLALPAPAACSPVWQRARDSRHYSCHDPNHPRCANRVASGDPSDAKALRRPAERLVQPHAYLRETASLPRPPYATLLRDLLSRPTHQLSSLPLKRHRLSTEAVVQPEPHSSAF